MLYNLLVPLADEYQVFNLFRYITFRSGMATLTALAVALIVGPRLINWLRIKQGKGQPIREDGPQTHLLTKKGTPTMGGLLILLSLLVTTLLWADLTNTYVWAVLLVTLGFGAIGFIDDYMKVSKRSPKGFAGKIKLVLEIAVAGIAVSVIVQATGGVVTKEPLATGLAVPFFKQVLVDLGWFFIPFGIFVIVGAGNAVNLTDGLDGLAIVPVMIAGATFGFIAYAAGHQLFSNYLGLHGVPGAGELTVLCGGLIGAGLGFLWYNAPPARVFMGDTGSLALGGCLGTIAVVVKHELVLAVVGGLFVLETVSVIVQVVSFKLTGKRVFRMAPIHHHFEQLGWAETTVVIRFWIIAVVLAILGLATLKLR